MDEAGGWCGEGRWAQSMDMREGEREGVKEDKRV
jgi:hypothetical protein